MFLTLPSTEYQESYIAALEEFRAEGSQEGLNLEKAKSNLPGLALKLREESEGKGLPEGWVPRTLYWLIDADEYIGEVSIRHYLNDSLRKIGGHIGYVIRPSKRRQGYGKKILELALPKAKELGIERALLTCIASNIASKKIIESAGGVFEREAPGENGPRHYYWIAP